MSILKLNLLLDFLKLQDNMTEAKKNELSPQGVPISESIPLRGISRITAQFMLRSHLENAELTGMAEVDFTKFLDYREKILVEIPNNSPQISVTHMMIKALASSLREHHYFNATLVEDEIKLLDEINIGMAVAIDNGQLIVPVIRNTDQKSLIEVAMEAERLSKKVRSGKIDIEDVSGGTFTFSNFGMFGGDIATPIIMPPQISIMALGRIISKPVVVDEKIVIRKMGWISQTVDHRIINGVQAAMFLRTLEEIIYNPEKLMRN